MEENRYYIKKYNTFSPTTDFNNCIYSVIDNYNNIYTFRFIKGNSFGIRIDKIYGREYV